jgi:hypothetical protein
MCACESSVIQQAYFLSRRKSENHLLTDYFHKYYVAPNPFNGIGNDNFTRVLSE